MSRLSPGGIVPEARPQPPTRFGKAGFPPVLTSSVALASAAPAPRRAPEPVGMSSNRTVAEAISGSVRNSRSSQAGRTKPRKDVY